MKKWEYKVRYIGPEDNLDEELDKEGLGGWELVAVTEEDHYYTLFFKREIKVVN